MLRANTAINAIKSNVFIGLQTVNRNYDNAVQNVSQAYANRLQRNYNNTKDYWMDRGEQMYRTAKQDYASKEITFDKDLDLGQYMQFVKRSERGIDNALLRNENSFNRSFERTRRTQNYLTSSDFKQLAGAGVVAEAGMIATSE